MHGSHSCVSQWKILTLLNFPCINFMSTVRNIFYFKRMLESKQNQWFRSSCVELRLLASIRPLHILLSTHSRTMHNSTNDTIRSREHKARREPVKSLMLHADNFMAIFTPLSVVILFSTGTRGVFTTLVYVFTMRVVIYDILSMAIIPTLLTSILFCNLCCILLWISPLSVGKSPYGYSKLCNINAHKKIIHCVAIFTIVYGNYYPPHGEFKLIWKGKFASRT